MVGCLVDVLGVLLSYLLEFDENLVEFILLVGRFGSEDLLRLMIYLKEVFE